MNIPDINYEIIRKLHPYYSNSYCNVSKLNSSICEESTYELLHIWAYPQFSIRELRAKFPNLTYNDVVAICLLYNPIPESINYYDPYSCFYYACMRKQKEADIYIRVNNGYLYDNTILWICYRYLQLPIIEAILLSPDFNTDDPEDIRVTPEDISNVRMFANMISLKLGGDLIYDIDTNNELGIMERAIMFTNEELIELFVLSSLVSEVSMWFTYLTSDERPTDPYQLREYYFVNSVASLVPKQRIQTIIDKYLEGFILPPVTYIKDGSFALGTGVIGPVSLYKHPEYIDKCIPDSQKALYYLTSGLIANYRQWVNAGFDIESVNSAYYGVNAFGDLTINNKLADLLGFDLSDVNSYPLSNIYRRYNC